MVLGINVALANMLGQPASNEQRVKDDDSIGKLDDIMEEEDETNDDVDGVDDVVGATSTSTARCTSSI